MNIEEMLLGIAIGDAFGAGVEFQDRNWIRKNVDFTRFVNARHQIEVSEDKKEVFTKNYQAWDYTDDTEMIIGVLKALMSDRDLSEDLLINKWKEEYDKGIAEKGFGRNGHGSMGWFYSGEKTMDQIRDFQRGRKNPGNAPAMRSIPFGFVREDLINQYCKINANATHPNINAIISSQCIARATEYILVKKGDQKKVIDYCRKTVRLNEEYSVYFDKIDSLGIYSDLEKEGFEVLCGSQPIQKPYFLSGINGVPSDSKYTTGCVLYILKTSLNPMDALMRSVNLGGDVDSVASITTGIMAGKNGLQSIPDFMRKEVEGINYLKKIGVRFKQYINKVE